jgi:hypothetical protein
MSLKSMTGVVAALAVLASPAFAANGTARINGHNLDARWHASVWGARFVRTVRDSQLVAADQVPNLDVRPGCQATDMADMSQQTCLEDERAARADLMKEWGQFSAQDKAICTDQSTNYHPSYVELLTCLEIARDAKSYTTRDGEVTNPAPKAGAGFAPD